MPTVVSDSAHMMLSTYTVSANAHKRLRFQCIHVDMEAILKMSPAPTVLSLNI